jgi:hypothetical protein
MTLMPIAAAHPTPIAAFIDKMRTGSPYLFAISVAFLLLSLICAGLQAFDERLIHGVNVWNKPAKFFLSIAVQYLTVSWALSLAGESQRGTRGLRVAVHVMAAAAFIEMTYIVFRALRGEASHFNTGTPFASAMYTAMGVGALSMTMSAAYVGIRIWRQRGDDIWREAAGLGLVVSAVLGTVAGAYMSSQTGHWVGGAPTDANGLGFFKWSTSGGDLRVAHFVGLHAAQFIPLAALSGRRAIVYGSAALVAILTCVTFFQAIAGMPLLAG